MKNDSEYTNEDIVEWNRLMSKCKKIYIYGASHNAAKIFEIVKLTGYLDKILGFLVTKRDNNPLEFEGLNVLEAKEIEEKNIHIFIPHSGVYKREINEYLQNLGFRRIHFVRKYINALYNKSPHTINDIEMREAIRRIEKKRENKTEEEKISDEKMIKVINQLRIDGNPDFGQDKFYQSYEELGIKGFRPSTYRLIKYGIDDLLNKNQTVLDIGCNCGFLDLMITSKVKFVRGIEYDKILVCIADYVKKYQKIDNCEFNNDDFNVWFNQNTDKYDVVFSFAIHHWLNIKPDIYIKKIDSLLLKGGIFFIESHEINDAEDEEYEKCIAGLRDRGYNFLTENLIRDDGVTLRKFAILKKVN